SCYLHLDSLHDIQLVHRIQGVVGFDIHTEILDDPGADSIDPAMDGQLLLTSPCTLHDRCLGQVMHLLDHIKLHKAVKPLGLVFNQVQLSVVKAIGIFDVPNPVIDQADGFATHGSFHPTTT